MKRLRRRGERIGDREIGADPGVVGHMTICQVETIIVAKFHAAGDDAQKKPMFPELFRARIVGMIGDRMLFQGYERIGDQNDTNSPAIKQEWAVQVMAEQPAELARTPHRPDH